MHINKSILLIVLFLALFSCTQDNELPVKLKVTYVNDTSDLVEFRFCNFDLLNNLEVSPTDAMNNFRLSIDPNESVTLDYSVINVFSKGQKDLTIEEVNLFESNGCQVSFSNGSSPLCYGGQENAGLNNILNYEVRNKVGERNFEFLFRFTEETKLEAVPCD